MASPTLRAVSGTYNYSIGATGFTTTEPTGAASGDILLLSVVLTAGTSGVTGPSGWTLLSSRTVDSDYQRYVWWIRRGGSAPALGVSWSLPDTWEWTMSAWTGAIASGNPFQTPVTNTVQSTGTQPDAAAVTTASPDTTVIVIGGSWRGFVAPAGAISGYTTAMNGTIGANSGFAQAIAYKAVAAQGASEDPGAMSNSVSGSDSNDAITLVLASTTPSAGGTDTPMTISVTQTQTASRGRAASRSLVASILQTVGGAPFQSGIAATLSATQTQTLTRTRAAALPRAATQTQTPSRARALARAFAVTIAQTLSFVKGQTFFKTLTVTITQSATRARALGLTRSANQTQTQTLTRAMARALAVAVTQDASRTFGFGYFKTLTATSTQTATRGRALGVTRTATNAQTPSIATRAIARLLVYTATQTATRARALARALNVTTSASLDLQSVPSGGGPVNVPKTLTATITQTATVLRAVTRALATTNVQTPVRTRALARALSVTNAALASFVKGQGYFKTLSTTQVQTASRGRALGVSRIANGVQSSTIRRALEVVRSATQLQTLTRLRGFFRTLLGFSTQSPSQTSGAGAQHEVELNVTQTQTASVTKQQNAGAFILTSREETVRVNPANDTIRLR